MPHQPCLALGQLPSHVQPQSSALQHRRLSPAQRYRDPNLTAGGDECWEDFLPQPGELSPVLGVLDAGSARAGHGPVAVLSQGVLACPVPSCPVPRGWPGPGSPSSPPAALNQMGLAV